MAAPPTMTSRDRCVTGVGLLRRFLQEDLAIARALKERRWAELAAVAEIAERDVDPELAATDPALYRALCDALTLYHLRGYHALDVAMLRRMERESNRREKQAPALS